MTPIPWWKTAVAYQIYPRSFCDTTGNGVGDLEGIRLHLHHLSDLGVDAIWLSPFFTSPMADYGYDVADYCDVDPLFGNLETFDALLAEAHELGLRVIIDWVPNHTSIEHPWFRASRSSRDDPRRDWYVWRDPAPDGGPPNNWIESLTFGPAWTLDETTGQYYLHCFLSQQPDLNWANPDVVDAMHDTLRFWLDRGVDGFRMDVVHLIGKDPALPDEPPELAGLPHTILNNRPETHALLRDLRRLVDSYPGDRMAIGEVYLLDTALVAQHYGHGDELHLCFNFPPLYTPFEAPAWRAQIEATMGELDAIDAWPTWVLSNHDNPRHRSRYGGDEQVARAAALLLLTLRGTPFLYAGEELGLEDAVVTEAQRHDPAGRDGCRAPIPWDASPSHGWAVPNVSAEPTDAATPGGSTSVAEPWLPWPPEAATRNPAVESSDDDSMMSLYRRLLRLRRAHPALSIGEFELVGSPDSVISFRRGHDGDDVAVAINMSAAPVAVDVAGELLFSTVDRGIENRFDGTLRAFEGIVVRADG